MSPLDFPCATCKAPVGAPCDRLIHFRRENGFRVKKRKYTHPSRVKAARKGDLK